MGRQVISLPSRYCVGTDSLRILFCLTSGLICLLPIWLQVPSNLERDSLRKSLSSSPAFTYFCAACIALTIPHFLDVLFDLCTMSFHAKSSAHNKNSTQGTVKFTSLNISERTLFLLGMVILPTIVFLPHSTDNLGLIYLCFSSCQQNFVGATVVMCLCRYDKDYFSERSTSFSVFCFGLGLASGTFVFNKYAGETSPSLSLYAIYIICYVFQLTPVLVFLVNSVRWLIIVHGKAYYWKGLLMCGSNVNQLIESEASTIRDTPKHTFFPMVYTVSTICISVLAIIVVGAAPRIEFWTSSDLLLSTVPFVLFLISISTLSMRMAKFEVVEALYAVIDSKKSYVRYISHELRTPLNSAFLGLKLLTDSLKNSEHPEDVERSGILVDVNVACGTTLDILNDLLCFDKMEDGILVAHKHKVSVISFISNCVDMFSAQAREANVTVTLLTCSDDTCGGPGSSPLLTDDEVFIDRFKMDQVLRNLLSNSLKFTPRGGSISVTCAFVPDMTVLQDLPFESSDADTVYTPHSLTNQQSKPPGLGWRSAPASPRGGIVWFNQRKPAPILSIESPGYTKGKLIIKVKDSGTGMVEEDYSRLFKEIVQFNPEVLQAGGGSGLGLWITKGIVDLHQGQITAYSEGLGYGSSFTVVLPMQRILQSTVAQIPDSRYTSIGTQSADNHHNSTAGSSSSIAPDEEFNISIDTFDEIPKPVYHLLVVDDSPLNRKMLMRTLKISGHICDEAEDGVMAVAKIREMMSSSAKAYSAILMDFVMPNMDGPTATKEIRSLGYTAPIFGVTGNFLDSDVRHFKDSGANLVLAKPFDMKIFEKAIQRSW